MTDPTRPASVRGVPPGADPPRARSSADERPSVDERTAGRDCDPDADCDPAAGSTNDPDLDPDDDRRERRIERLRLWRTLLLLAIAVARLIRVL